MMKRTEGKERKIEKQGEKGEGGEKSQEGGIRREGDKGLIEEWRGGAVNRETGLMAEPTAGSLGSGGPINKRVTAINIAWQVISTVAHAPQGHCWRKGP